MVIIQPRASVVFCPGAAVVHRDGVQLGEIPLSTAPRTDLVTLGRFVGDKQFTASSNADSNGGALNDDGSAQCITVCPFSEVGTGWFATGTSTHQITEAMIDRPAFWFDDGTLYPDDLNGTLSYAGHIAAVDPGTGRVALKTGELWRVLYELYSAGQGPGTAVFTSNDDVRAVATSLPAGTFSGGVLTLTATGAFSTAQDGVTLAVGDKFIIPAGTITTLVVSAANSGVYEVTSLGATGVSASFTRTAKWAHGATIKPETELKVAEGTLFKGSVWYADPATATKVVGTDDPVLYPRSVTQTVTLVASAKAITNVPIKSSTKSNVVASLAAVGGTTTNTIGWGIIVAPTPGGIGTATTTVNAIASGGTKNGTSDTSDVIVTIFN